SQPAFGMGGSNINNQRIKNESLERARKLPRKARGLCQRCWKHESRRTSQQSLNVRGRELDLAIDTALARLPGNQAINVQLRRGRCRERQLYWDFRRIEASATQPQRECRAMRDELACDPETTRRPIDGGFAGDVLEALNPRARAVGDGGIL